MKIITFRLSAFFIILITAGCGPGETELALQDDNQKLRTERDTVKLQVQSFAKKLDEATEALALSQQNLSQMQQRLGRADQQESALLTSRRMADTFRDKVEQLDTQLTQNQLQQAKIKTENASLLEQQQQNETLLASEREKTARQSAEIAQSQADNQKLTSEIDAIRLENDKVKSAMADALKTIEGLQAERLSLQQKISAEEDKVKQLDIQLTKSRLQQVKNKTQISGLLEQQQQHETLYRSEQQKTARQSAQISQSQAANLKLTTEIDSARLENEKVKSAIADANKTIADLQADHGTLQQQFTAEKNKTSSQAKTIAALNAELATTRQALQSFKDERSNLSDKISLTTEQLNAARDRAAQLNSDYKTMLDTHNQLQEVDSKKQHELEVMRKTLETSQAEIARLTGARGIYTVQKNDSLSTIASFFYRNGNLWTKIWQANQHMLPKEDLIYEGMVLVVPQISAAARPGQ